MRRIVWLQRFIQDLFPNNATQNQIKNNEKKKLLAVYKNVRLTTTKNCTGIDITLRPEQLLPASADIFKWMKKSSFVTFSNDWFWSNVSHTARWLKAITTNKVQKNRLFSINIWLFCRYRNHAQIDWSLTINTSNYWLEDFVTYVIHKTNTIYETITNSYLRKLANIKKIWSASVGGPTYLRSVRIFYRT